MLRSGRETYIGKLGDFMEAQNEKLFSLINLFLYGGAPDRESAEQELNKIEIDYERILVEFRNRLPKRWDMPTPSRKKEHFSRPALAEKHPAALLFFAVPRSYKPSTQYKLLVFMHGGGEGVPLDNGSHYLTDHPSCGMSPVIDEFPCIAVAPSAPFQKISNDRWAKGGAEDYISDVIDECMYRFNIDPDGVYLAGQSMGGSGVYGLIGRIGDRFGGALAASGSWRKMNFSCAAGTPLCILHARNDAEAGVRPRFTDFFCAQTAHLLLEKARIEHLYLPHDYGHTISAKRLGHKLLRKALNYTIEHRRDPFFPRVVAMNPCSTTQFYGSPDIESPHHRWITIDRTGPGTVEVAGKKLTGPYPSRQETPEDFAKQSFSLTREATAAGVVDAVYRGDNFFECSAENVELFSIWLHPDMVSFANPVRVSVNGEVIKFTPPAPSLTAALRSYLRRKDWGLIYPSKIKVPVPRAR